MPKRPDYNDTNEERGLISLGSLPGASPVAAFNPEMTESLLKTKGINALHYKHAPSPDRETIAGGVNPNTNAAKMGWRYYSVRQMKVVTQQFKLEDRLNVQGIFGQGSVLLNVAGHYDDENKDHVFCRPFDIVVIQSACDGSPITTMAEQLSEYNPNGPLKLNFRCEGIDYLADRNRQYYAEQDFMLDDGKIKWLNGGQKPSFKDGKGDILSVVYWIKPIYIVQNVPHSIRITPGNDMGHAAYPRKAHYAPQLVIAKQAQFRLDTAEELLDFSGLPSYNHYRDSGNTTGGS